jgi:adenine phosphoribosyltransferase
MIAMNVVEQKLRQVADFPKPGINFLDMSPILADGSLFKSVIHHLCEPQKEKKIDKIIAIESRGFILGAAMAHELGSGLVMVRKKGKLPGPTVSVSYALEYGTDQLEMLPQNVSRGENVLIVDDVLATGGTAAAAGELCEKLGGNVVGFSFFIEIGFLQGRKKLSQPVHSLLMK